MELLLSATFLFQLFPYLDTAIQVSLTMNLNDSILIWEELEIKEKSIFLHFPQLKINLYQRVMYKYYYGLRATDTIIQHGNIN